MDSNEISQCNLKFALNETVNTTYVSPRVYIVFTEITLNDSKKAVILKDDLHFSLNTSFKNEATAQHGFIIFDDWDNSCALESIAREDPYVFEDDSEILYIRSTYRDDFNRTSPCKWNFIAPKGYGFKFVVEIWNVSDLTLLTAINKTDTITNEIGLQTYHAYYNPDQWMQITLSKDHEDKTLKLEFQAYVTIVLKEFQNTDAKCTNVTTGPTTIWTMNKEKGYGKNVNCTHLLIIPPTTEILVKIDEVVFEKGVDYIKYYPEGNRRNYTTFDSGATFILEPLEAEEGHKNKTFVWEFVSDGSVQASGFNVSFMEMPCVCSNKNIDCNVPYFHVMNFTDRYYCGSLNCNFDVSTCSADMLEIIFEPHDIGAQRDLYDVFTVYSNNVPVLEIDSTNRYLGKFPVYLNSKNDNKFEVVANVSKNVKWLDISVKPFIKPKIDLNVTLSDSQNNTIIDTSKFPFVLFQIDHKKLYKSQAFVVYSTFSQGGALYNNESLSLKLFNEQCFDKLNSSYKCHINSPNFVAYTPKDSDKFPFLAVRLSDGHKGCLFDENIFSTKNESFVSISAISTSEGDCDITVLIDDLNYYFVSHLYTTSEKESVRVFIGTDQTKEYFSFTSSTASNSINTGLFSKVYTIKIPKSSTFLMYLTQYDFNPIIISQKPYQAFITTPNFATTKRNALTSDVFVTYEIGKNINVRFTAKEYKMGKNDNFYFMVDNQQIKIGKAGDSKTFKNQKVTLHYSYDKNSDFTNGALFFIETL
uniref:CUB domain-containing protein n=1 Tax=Panagrolaimus davidi TaxID=227884 RepID=A0A914Q611_9BILA